MICKDQLLIEKDSDAKVVVAMEAVAEMWSLGLTGPTPDGEPVRMMSPMWRVKYLLA